LRNCDYPRRRHDRPASGAGRADRIAGQDRRGPARRQRLVSRQREQGYLRAELFNRQTAEETKEFLETVLASALQHRLPLVLICVRNSAPIFTVERYGFSRYLDLAFESKYKIALVGDTLELRIAHQYIERWRAFAASSFARFRKKAPRSAAQNGRGLVAVN